MSEEQFTLTLSEPERKFLQDLLNTAAAKAIAYPMPVVPVDAESPAAIADRLYWRVRRLRSESR